MHGYKIVIEADALVVQGAALFVAGVVAVVGGAIWVVKRDEATSNKLNARIDRLTEARDLQIKGIEDRLNDHGNWARDTFATKGEISAMRNEILDAFRRLEGKIDRLTDRKTD